MGRGGGGERRRELLGGGNSLLDLYADKTGTSDKREFGGTGQERRGRVNVIHRIR